MAGVAISDAAGLVQHGGQMVVLHGRYVVEDLRPHGVIHELPDGRLIQVSRVVILLLEDGTRVRLWVRPEEEMQRLNGASVLATGRLVLPAPVHPTFMAAPEPGPSLVDIAEVVSA